MPVRAKQCTRDGKELPEPKGPCFKVFGGESIPLQQSTEGQAGFKRCSKLDDLLESLLFFSGEILNLPWGGGEEVGNNLLKYVSGVFWSLRHRSA